MAKYNLFTNTPSIAAAVDGQPVNLGTEFFVTDTGWVTEIRYLQPATGGSSTQRTCGIYRVIDNTYGTLVAGPFTMPVPVAGQWCVYKLPSPLLITQENRYRVAVRHPGDYCATANYFTAAPYDVGNFTQGILVVPYPVAATGGKQGTFTYNAALTYPSDSYNSGCYYSDVTVTDTNPAYGPPEWGQLWPRSM